jgi:acetolactate synthase-1/2/3 large subunit
VEHLAMNGARSLVRTLVDAGVEVCFANPGTSEMHFVSALDEIAGMRGVLGLFEGVVTGAADGYARMTDRPAATLLHCGPGLANGLANLHNASRAGVPIVNVVGDHAIYHKRLDAPLETDIDALAGTVSGWVRRSYRPQDVGADAADAVAAAQGPPGQIATLILPANVSWEDGGVPGSVRTPRPAARVPDAQVAAAAAALTSGEPAVLMLGGMAQRERGLRAASRIAVATGAQVSTQTHPARLQRGVGLPAFDRLPYFVEDAVAHLAGNRHMILAGTAAPVAFFAYPDLPGSPTPQNCAVHELGAPGQDIVEALEHLADRVAPDTAPLLQAPTTPGPRAGALTTGAIAELVAAHLPEDAIVVDEAITAGVALAAASVGAPRHDWLCVTGGAIGYGLPTAVGAAVACPGRPVINLQADGSALYTIQALWTQARENLDVTTVLLNNHSYAILEVEMNRVLARSPGDKSRDLLSLTDPDIDFVKIANGLGVAATRATTAEELAGALRFATAEPGPHLIEAAYS